MLTSIDVKFIFDSARLGLFSSADILQIADVALRVVFLLFLLCFQLLFRLVLTFETSEISAIFVFTTKTTQPRPRVFSINGALTCKEACPLTRAESLALSSLFVVCEGTKTLFFKPFFLNFHHYQHQLGKSEFIIQTKNLKGESSTVSQENRY